MVYKPAMKFNSPELVNQAIWTMRLADVPRGTNRANVNRLMNGWPPYTEEERQANNVEINVNFLDAPQLLADSRRSYYNGFQAGNKFFTITTDYGPPYSRIKWGRIITRELARIMKGSRLYAECLDSQFAGTTLHGVGPAVWLDRDHWCPEEKGIEDVLIPGDTLRSLRNLDHFAVYYQYTAEQLWRLTHGPKVDPAWNMDMVESALDWAHGQTQSQLSYSDLFSPEKVEERFKEDLGFYGTDSVPTIDFWKFFYHEDRKKQAGWRMKVVLDTPGEYEIGARAPSKNKTGSDQDSWLYDPGDRVYADKIEELIHFQFGDLSAVSPFRYHSIRSLGWLIYSVCHLQNRLLCKYYESVIEHLNQYFRGNESDKTRVTKVDLVNYGFVPDGLSFVRPEERWRIDGPLAQEAMNGLRQRLEYSAAQYRQGRDMGVDKEKTATQVMAEVNSSMAMVGTMLMQAYRYQKYQYQEICRRFCRKGSSDPDVRSFRVRVLKEGVPEEALNVACWNVEPEKVMGGGNKTLQLAMADSLLQMRPILDPEAQKVVDRIVIATRTDNDDLADRLVPEIKAPSASAQQASAMFATLMMGIKVPPATGVNHVDVIETLMGDMAQVLQRITASGGQTDPKELMGLQNVAQQVGLHLQILSQNKLERERVRKYGKELGQIMNLVKALAQQMVKAAQAKAKQQGQGNGMDPQMVAKMQAEIIKAQAKADIQRKSHAQRTAEREVQFDREEARKDRQTAADIQRENAKSMAETFRTGVIEAASAETTPEPTEPE